MFTRKQGIIAGLHEIAPRKVSQGPWRRGYQRHLCRGMELLEHRYVLDSALGQEHWYFDVDPSQHVNALAIDEDGNVFITGSYSTGDDNDAYVAKIVESEGTVEQVWRTVLGGEYSDSGEDITVSADGNYVFVAGGTASSGWVSGGYDTRQHGSDGFVVKLDAATGNYNDPALDLWSTYIGGNHSQAAGGIALDASGDIVVVGRSSSDKWLREAVTQGFDITANGHTDTFVAKISANGQQLLWGTLLGGDSFDSARGVTVDADGEILVVGDTTSEGWISSGLDDTLGGERDGFAAKVSGDGQQLLWARYLGGSGREWAYDVAVDDAGNATVVGATGSTNWLGSLDGERDAYVLRLDPDGHEVEDWSTYLGGSDRDVGYGVALDGDGNALVTGYTQSSDWIVGGFDDHFDGPQDAFVAEVSSSGQHVWSSYVRQDNYGTDIALDGSGSAYVAGYGTEGSFVAKILIDSGPPAPGITVTPSSNLITSEDVTTDEFTVVLDTLPAGDVVLNVASLDESEGTVAPLTLTFTTTDWDQPQSVVLTGKDDQEQDGDVAYFVEVTVDPDATTDPAYDVLSPIQVSATNLDDETAPTTRYDATGETAIHGTVSGTYQATLQSDNSYESIIEEKYAGKRSRLEHQWSFDVTGGSAATFYIEAHHNSSVENFVFEYSVDGGSSWTEMVTVTKTVDDNVAQEFGLQEPVTGMILVQVRDTNRSKEAVLDTIYVDEMYFESAAAAASRSGDSSQPILAVPLTREAVSKTPVETTLRADAETVLVESVTPFHTEVGFALTSQPVKNLRAVDDFMTHYGQEREANAGHAAWVDELPWEAWEQCNIG